MNPSISSELIINAQSIRARLRYPSNAVRDDGIDLKRLPRGFELRGQRMAPEIQIIKIEPVEEVPAVPVITPFRPVATLSSFFVARLIIDLVAAAYDLNAEAMKSPVRTDRLVKPRQLAMYLVRTMIKPERSLPWIGRVFGGRDHSTVHHAVRAVKTRIETDPEFAATVEKLRKEINI